MEATEALLKDNLDAVQHIQRTANISEGARRRELRQYVQEAGQPGAGHRQGRAEQQLGARAEPQAPGGARAARDGETKAGARGHQGVSPAANTTCPPGVWRVLHLRRPSVATQGLAAVELVPLAVASPPFPRQRDAPDGSPWIEWC